MNRTDTYKIASSAYDESADTLTVEAFLASSPNHDAPYATFDESPMTFQIVQSFSDNSASIKRTSDMPFESNAAYVPSVMCAFARAFETIYDKLHWTSSPAEVTIESFDVAF